MISYQEAVQLIDNEFLHLPKSIIDTDLTGSLGYTLAENIYADTNLPSFDYSGMDGYAINYSNNKKKWVITGEISAGNYKEYILDEDSAVRIMTGGRIPLKANAVIPIEEVVEEDTFLSLRKGVKIKMNQNIRFKGEDLLKGSLALKENTRITPRNLPLAAGCGKANLKVNRKFVIGVLATGNELIDISENPGEDKVRSTNQHSLLASVKNMNLTGVNLGIVKDDKELLRNAVTSALNSDLDILLTTGGVSVGKYDLLKEVFKEAGVETIFWRVNIKPGKPLYFGRYSNGNKIKLIFGLPGNPVSAFVNFEVLIKPAILKYYGNETFNCYPAVLDFDIKKKDDRRYFLRGTIRYIPEVKIYFVKESGSRSSGNLAGLSNSNCLIVIPEEVINPPAGEKVECIII
jgi:molybdopterin molybdotransferase